MGPVVRAFDSSTVPATYAHDENGERIEWMPSATYRLWRDVGLRGYGPDGLPSGRFRGGWAACNATFSDLMVRTGLRLTEQASVTVFEVPTSIALGGYQRFWLPGVIAKNFSSRWVYVPHSTVQEVIAYVEWDRAEVVEQARAAGRYQRLNIDTTSGYVTAVRVPLLINGVSAGLTFMPAASLVMGGVEPQHAGSVSGLLQTVQQLAAPSDSQELTAASRRRTSSTS